MNFQGSSEPEILEARGTVSYVWDDLSLPHKLVIIINGRCLSSYFILLLIFATTNFHHLDPILLCLSDFLCFSLCHHFIMDIPADGQISCFSR